MPRYRQRPINPFLQFLMDLNGHESLKEINTASHGELQISSLSYAADIDETNKTLEFHMKMAKFFGIPMETWVRGLLNQLSPKELNELKMKLDKAS